MNAEAEWGEWIVDQLSDSSTRLSVGESARTEEDTVAGGFRTQTRLMREKRNTLDLRLEAAD